MWYATNFTAIDYYVKCYGFLTFVYSAGHVNRLSQVIIKQSVHLFCSTARTSNLSASLYIFRLEIFQVNIEIVDRCHQVKLFDCF